MTMVGKRALTARYSGDPNYNTHVVAFYQNNITASYRSATPDHIRDGRAWYRMMHTIMIDHATASGLSVRQCSQVYAYASINQLWKNNVRIARHSIDHYTTYRNAPTDGALGITVRGIRDVMIHDMMLDDMLKDPDALKIRSFWRNLCDDASTVTIDRWALRIAYGLPSGGYVPKGDHYREIASAYHNVARIVGERVHDLQAITWCVIRGDGN